MPPEILAGVGSELITPEIGCLLAGFDARKGVAEKVHDDLFARALVLDDGRNAVALVSIDVIAVGHSFAAAVRSEIEKRTGIPARNALLSATHTHCGPVTINHFFNQGQPLDQQYMDRLACAIVSSVERAHQSRSPRRLRTGFVPVSGVAVNRRTANGEPIDPTAGVLALDERDGTPATICVFYACHPTTLGPNTLEITADFPFYAIQRLKELYGADTDVLFFNGAEGDLSVGHRSDLSAVGVIAPNRTFERAEELGNRLAECVASGLANLEAEKPQLKVASMRAALPLKRYASPAEMRSRREQAGVAMRAAEESGADEREVIPARQRSLFSRIEEYYATLEDALPEPKVLDAELTAFRAGDTVMLSLPGEVFVEIALAIRDRSPFPKTMFAGLTNDYIGYVPTANANRELGYEVVASRVSSGAEAALIDASLQLLRRLKDNSEG